MSKLLFMIGRFARALVFTCAGLLLVACQGPHAEVPAGPSGTQTESARPQALPFIEDDYSRALGDAVRRKAPLFVEAWAPW